MKLHQLRDFIAIADTGSLRGAARKLQLSPPALVKSLAALEHELHVPLLTRGSRGMALTDYGHALLQRARAIDDQAHKAHEEIAQLRGKLEGALAVGASATPSVLLLPPAVVELQRAMPAVRVNVVDGIYKQHIEAIRSGRVDFAVTAIPDQGLDSDIVCEELFRNDLVVAARRGHPHASAQSLRELVDCAWIVTGPDATGPGAAILDAYRALGMAAPQPAAQCSLNWGLHALLLESDMVCALPRLLFARFGLDSALQQIPVREPLPSYRIGLVHSATAPLLPSAKALATLLRRHAAYLAPPA